MSEGARTGIHFGLTSGVITTLGLMVGLHSGTQSTQAVLGGIITIAVADAMSDALGIHISKEAERQASTRDIWHATLATLATKFFMAASFVLPVLLLPLRAAILASIGWGLLVLTALSMRLAREQEVRAWPVIAEHLGIALAVVALAHWVGEWIARIFPAS